MTIVDLSDSAFKKIFSTKEFFLPIRWDGADFLFTLDNLFETYINRIECEASKCKENHETNIITNVNIESIYMLCHEIKNAVRKYLAGFPSEAFEMIAYVMEKLMREKPLQIYTKNVWQPFDSMYNNDPLNLFRVVCVEDNKPCGRERVFHTPNNLRSKVSTNRYSIAGYPCLYLGTNLRLCCEEIHMNPYQKFAIASKFKIDRKIADKKIKVIELAIKPQDFLVEQQKTNSETPLNINWYKKRKIDDYLLNGEEIKKRYLLWYPLIAACSYIRVNKSDPFAAEYIIPQLIMQWTRSTNKFHNRNEILGIRYFSCASVKASDMGFNYVFPVSEKINRSNTLFCPILSDAFKLTEPHYICEYDSIDECEEALIYDNDLEKII